MKAGQADPRVLEEVDFRPTAAERAAVDTWSGKLTAAQCAMFTLPDN
jgi:hypothetical protein